MNAPDGTEIDENGFIVEPGHPQEGVPWSSCQGATLWHVEAEKLLADFHGTRCIGCGKEIKISEIGTASTRASQAGGTRLGSAALTSACSTHATTRLWTSASAATGSGYVCLDCTASWDAPPARPTPPQAPRSAERQRAKALLFGVDPRTGTGFRPDLRPEARPTPPAGTFSIPSEGTRSLHRFRRMMGLIAAREKP